MCFPELIKTDIFIYLFIFLACWQLNNSQMVGLKPEFSEQLWPTKFNRRLKKNLNRIGM